MPFKYSKRIEQKLRYPDDLNPDRNDFIQFTHWPYRANDALYKKYGSFDPGTPRMNGPVHQGNEVIQLYMPNSTPGTANNQEWSSQKFIGEKGQRMKQILQGMAGGGTYGERDVGAMRNSDTGEMLKQSILEAATGMMGMDASTALQLGRGQVYNPNVEMMYKMPTLREFNFTFDFVPKTSKETGNIDDIILAFKRWSSPAMEENHKFLSVPHLWGITYFEAGGKQFRRLNKFKFCVLQGLQVTENPNSNFHMTIDDSDGPAPVHTKLQLTFIETDILLRQDHDRAVKEGYRRGY